jgi:hypothetical protein
VSVLVIAALLAAQGIRDGAEMRDIGIRPPLGGSALSATVTLDAMPYTRTVSCGSYTLTGDYTGSVPTWSASPSGASGSCSDTGGGNFSCVVDVDPDAVGEGVETITVTTGSATDTETIGFYVDGEHSCFLAQSVNGSYNSGLSDLDAVTTWENLGSSALDVTQGGAATLKPTFRTGIVGGQPVVRCDGGDFVRAATASDWDFLHSGSDVTTEILSVRSSAGTTLVVSNKSAATDVGLGSHLVSENTWNRWSLGNGASNIFNISSAASSVVNGTANLVVMTVDDDGGAGADGFLTVNGTTTSATAAAAYSATTAERFTICSTPSGSFWYVGDVFAVRIYQSALSSTQRGINEAVDEWALGGTVPVVAERWHFDSSDSATITTAGSAVSAWRSTGITTGSADQGNASRQPTSTVSGTSSNVDFDGAEDYLELAGQNSVSNWHTFAVVTVDAVDTNGTGGNCELNDYITLDVASGLRLRNDAGTYYAIAHNNDGTDDCAEVAISIGSKMIIEGKADGTNVSIAVDGGSFTSVASGNQTSAAGTLYLGGQAFAYLLNGKIHEVRQFPDDLGTTERNAVIAELQSKWGL